MKSATALKILILLILLLCNGTVYAQPKAYYELELERMPYNEMMPVGKAIIYGDFFRRDMKGSAGAWQDVTLRNDKSGVIYRMVVKQTFKSAKHAVFCYIIPEGQYTLLDYKWMQHPPGALNNSENVSFNKQLYKDYSGHDSFTVFYGRYINQLDTASLHPYHFTVDSAGLYYVGEWHFEEDVIRFVDNKELSDKRLVDAYFGLKFILPRAKKSIPQ